MKTLPVYIMLSAAVVLLVLIGWQSWQEGSAAAALHAQAEIERARVDQQEAINELVESATFWPGVMFLGLGFFASGIFLIMSRIFFETQKQRDIRDDKQWQVIYGLIGQHKAEKIGAETRKEIEEYERIINIPISTDRL